MKNFVIDTIESAITGQSWSASFNQELLKAAELAKLQAQAVDLLREVKKRYVVPPDSIPKRIRDLLKSIDEVSKR